MAESLTEPAKLLLLAALLTNDKIISNNGKSFLKEMILRRDSRVALLLKKFEGQKAGDSSFLEALHELIMMESQSLYNELFYDTSLEVGKTLSKKERDSKELMDEKSLIYGEVEYNSFYRVLRKINPPAGQVFYDLGSGTGKAVFAARFAYDFSKCIGIEILSSLHAQAAVVVDRYNKSFRQLLALGQDQHAMVYEGSFLDFDWSDGDVVFANSTCFDDALMLDLSRAAEKLKPGAMVVTFTKGMTNTAGTFELLERKRYRMSWGPATVFIHRRLQRDGSPVGPPTLNVLPSDNITYDDEVRNKGGADSDADSSDEEDVGEEEDRNSEEGSDGEGDLDYDDDIDLYIRQGFDMDPGNREDEGSEESGEEGGAEEGESSGSESSGADGSAETVSDGGEEGDDDDQVSQDEESEEERGASKDAEQQARVDAIMAKVSEQRRQVSALTSSPNKAKTAAAGASPSANVTASVGSSFSPPRSGDKKQGAKASPGQQQQDAGSAAGGTHKTPEKRPLPAREAATVTIEAPLSASRGKGLMLSPALMRSPANGQNGADSPSVQIHSPLDNALLMRKRAAAVNRRVPMSAFPTDDQEE